MRFAGERKQHEQHQHKRSQMPMTCTVGKSIRCATNDKVETFQSIDQVILSIQLD